MPAPPPVQLVFKASNSTHDPKSIHPSLPMRPSFDTFAAPTPAPPPTNQANAFEEGSKALSGSNHDVVANRSAIRMANMSAAEVLKAELAGLKPLKPKASSGPAVSAPNIPPPVPTTLPVVEAVSMAVDSDIPGLDVIADAVILDKTILTAEISTPTDTSYPPTEALSSFVMEQASPVAGVKRKLEDFESGSADQSGVATPLEEVEAEDTTAKKRTVNADGTVESEDTVKYVTDFRFKLP